MPYETICFSSDCCLLVVAVRTMTVADSALAEEHGKLEMAAALVGRSREVHHRGIRDLFVLPLTNGMLIETVVPDSPAAEVGLSAGTIDVVVSGQPWMMGGDILIAVRATRVSTVQEFWAVLKELEIGQTIDIDFIRDRERQKTILTVQERPQIPYGQFVRSMDTQYQGRKPLKRDQ